MSKRITALLLATIILLVLSSCAPFSLSTDEPSENNNSAQATEVTTDAPDPEDKTDEPTTDETAVTELMWVLVDSHYGLSNDVNDGDHHYRYSYLGEEDGKVCFKMDGGFYGDGGQSHCSRIYKCTIPVSTFPTSALLQVEMQLFVEEFTVSKAGSAVWVPDEFFEVRTYDNYSFMSETGFSKLFVGPADNKMYPTANASAKDTFSLYFPPADHLVSDYREGQQITLRWNFGGGSYDWVYELKAQG